MEKLNALGNITYDEKEEYAIFSVNPKIYSLELVQSAAYVCIDKMYIMLDGDPEKEIKVEIRKKKTEQDIKSLLMDFNNELLNYAVYKQMSEKNRVIRETILQRLLLTNSPEYLNTISKQETCLEVYDPEGIMKPWKEEGTLDNQEDKRTTDDYVREKC